MINNAIEKFRVNQEGTPNYTVYYKNPNGSCYCYGVNYNRHGCAVINPSRKITTAAYDFAKPHGIEF